MIRPMPWYRPGRHGYVVGLVLRAEIPGAQIGRHISVSHFHPSGQTDPATNITIRFSDDLVPADSPHRPVVEPPVKFSPERLLSTGRIAAATTCSVWPKRVSRPA